MTYRSAFRASAIGIEAVQPGARGIEPTLASRRRILASVRAEIAHYRERGASGDPVVVAEWERIAARLEARIIELGE